MAVFAIADVHLSLSSDKPMNVFPGWEDHVRRLSDNWRRVVGPGDTVVIDGDISWAMQLEEAGEDLAFLDSLPGTKILCRGNHDYWWTSLAKMNAFFDQRGFTTLKLLRNNAIEVEGMAVCGTRGWYFDSGEEHDAAMVRREVCRLGLSLEAAAKTGLPPVVFLHYPPISVCGGENDILALLESSGVKRVYYGHLHGERNDRCRAVYTGPLRLTLISADYLGFCPIQVEKF